MQSLFEEPVPDPVSDLGSGSIDTISPTCDGAMNKVSVHLCCVFKCV